MVSIIVEYVKMVLIVEVFAYDSPDATGSDIVFDNPFPTNPPICKQNTYKRVVPNNNYNLYDILRIILDSSFKIASDNPDYMQKYIFVQSTFFT